MPSSETYLTTVGKDKSCWTHRTGVEKRLLLWVLILIPVILALVIALAVVSNDFRLYKQKHHDLQDDQSTEGSKNVVCTTPVCVQTAASMLEHMDLDTDPCEDFLTFSCGQWQEKHPIPDEKGRFGQFDILDEKINQYYKTLLSAPIENADAEAIRKAMTMYKSCVNEEMVWNTTLPSLLKSLTSFGGWPMMMSNWSMDDFDWINLEATISRFPPSTSGSSAALIETAVYFDAKNTTRNILYFDQPPLSLGRDYLLKAENFSRIIDAYRTLIQRIALFLGKNNNISIEQLTMDIEDMIALESNIAKISLSPEKRRDDLLTYSNMTIRELNDLTKNQIDWLRFTNILFQNITQIDENEEIVVSDKGYVIQMVDLINSTSTRTLANYILWRYVLPLMIHTSRETQLYVFEFAKVLTGVTRANPRWKVCTQEVDKSLGMALGSMFVKKHFPEKSKTTANEMIGNLRSAFEDMLHEVNWMDSITKNKALEKVETMTENIGYPEWILNADKLNKYYENVNVTKDDYFNTLGSAANAKVLESITTLREIPADKSKWYMTPGTVNAYYSRRINSINFPAGILQTPFFFDERTTVLNYGAIGAVIGHEITHGFDDQGRLYDKDGNLNKWWSDEVSNNFQKQAKCYINQYSKYCPEGLNGICVNGNLTVGENIADNGGLKAAFKAYQIWKMNNTEEARLPGLEIYSAEQLFFISFSQVWCSDARMETLRNLIFRDPHSPAAYRIIGTVSNSREFAAVYNCKNGTPMNRGIERCELW